MINRSNYQDVQAFLRFQREVKQSDEKTISALWSRLRHLLEWADEKRFTDAYRIRPTFPVYLGNLKKPDGNLLIGTAYFASVCKTARAFFDWACREYRTQYKRIDQNWIVSLRPPKSRSEQSQLKKREIYEFEEVLQIARCPVESLMLRRAQAAVCLLYLSGMRVGAFVSLPARCVDLERMTVSQLPELGVNTKNHKAAVTTLLNIPELLPVVQAWDALVRREGQSDVLWYANFTQQGEIAAVNPSAARIKTRQHDFIDDLRKLCSVAGVAYKSSHKLRHGHVVYGIKRARNIEQLKAISQNVMHSSVGITDGIYGRLVADDVHETIAALTVKETKREIDQEVVARVAELVMAQMKDGKV